MREFMVMLWSLLKMGWAASNRIQKVLTVILAPFIAVYLMVVLGDQFMRHNLRRVL